MQFHFAFYYHTNTVATTHFNAYGQISHVGENNFIYLNRIPNIVLSL